MKIEFLSSRLHSIQSNHNISQKLTTRCPQNLNNSERLGPVVRINFRGNFDKNAKQFINIAAEDKGLGLKEYSKGGLAVVVKEANDEVDKAISNHLKAISVNSDFVHSYKNLGVLFLARGEKEDAKEYFEDYMKFDIPQEEKDTISGILKKLN